MKIQFDKKITASNEVKVESLKKRRWDRWLYLGILIFLVVSFVRWITTPLLFNVAQGTLLQQQYDVQFANDIRILEYHVAEDSMVSVGDTLFSYEKITANHTTYAQDSLQVELNSTQNQSAILALTSQIEKRRLFIADLQKRLQYWESQKKDKEQLVYLNVVAPGELSTISRTIDDIQFQINTFKAELKVLIREKAGLSSDIRNRDFLNSSALATAHQHTYFTAPVAGRVDRLRIPVQQVCYKQEKVLSLLYPEFYVRAYIDMEDLDKFKAGDHVVVVLPYDHRNLQGIVKKLYAVSELKDDIVFENNLSDKKHGIVVDIVPSSKDGWDSLTVSNVPVKIRKGKINL